jgi:hypothetical protein
LKNHIYHGGIIAQYKVGISKGFAYGWEENGAHSVSYFGAHFMKYKFIPISLLTILYGLISQHGGGIQKGFAYGWEENGSLPVSFLGAHFMKDKCIPFSL